MGTLYVDKLDPQSGTSLELGSSGDTITIPSGATITNNGTASGFATTPVAGTEAFSAKLTGNDNNITDSSWYKITFNNEVFDTGSNFDTSTGRYTAPSAGKYFFGVAIYAWGGNNFDNAATRLYKNGVSNGATGNYFTYSDGKHFSEWYQEASQVLDLAQNDYIEVYQRLDFSSGAANIDAVSRFYGFKLA